MTKEKFKIKTTFVKLELITYWLLAIMTITPKRQLQVGDTEKLTVAFNDA